MKNKIQTIAYRKILAIVFMCLISTTAIAQDITNTLVTNGVFNIKDDITTFFTLKQNSGNVGIGIIDPIARLDVNGNGYLRGNLSLSATNPFIAFNDNGFIQSYDDNHRIIFDRQNNLLKLQEYGEILFSTAAEKIERMRIANNGNVGIGTTTPTAKLDLVGGDAKINGLVLGRGGGNISTNSVLGDNSLTDNTSGMRNTSVGAYSLHYNISGNYNTANGYSALLSNLSGHLNTALGAVTLVSNTQGNSNTAVGSYALYLNTMGNYNTAIGNFALNSNTTAGNNTAIGYQTLYFNTGSDNTSVGVEALYANNTGYSNCAFGFRSQHSNTTGHDNTSHGSQSLYNNTTGYYNTAIGFNSLYSNTEGQYNTALGTATLYSNITGHRNTAAGNSALFYNTTGIYNTAFGVSSLQNNTSGEYNTALGYNAGYSISTGSNLLCLGSNAQPTSGDATNQITLGNNQITSLRCNVTTITSLSDARDKKNIQDLELGIDFLMKIKPRQFNWDKREWYENNLSDSSKMKETPTAGFIAQELDEAQAAENVEWLNLVLKDNPEKWEATPGNLLPIMVKAIQELKAENDQLRIKIADLSEIKEQIAEIENLKAELKEQLRILRTSNNSEEVKFISVMTGGIEK